MMASKEAKIRVQAFAFATPSDTESADLIFSCFSDSPASPKFNACTKARAVTLLFCTKLHGI